uniref:Uncharacterized protein n=1 Tax=Fagus sylvatica TaxID=28930 RepID=A0A2N9EU65_FAGSY
MRIKMISLLGSKIPWHSTMFGVVHVAEEMRSTIVHVRAGFDGLVMVLGNDWQSLRDCWMDLKDKNGGFGYVLGNWGLSEVIKARRSGSVVGWVTKSI